MDRAAVLGYGMVGKATADLFGIQKHFDVHTEKTNISLQEAAKQEYLFICLPTPVDGDGKYRVNEIIELIRQIEDYGSGATYVLRSTVNPGFAIHLQRTLGIDRVISNPEFLSEDTAESDIKNPPFVLLGGLEGQYLEKVAAIYKSRIKSAPIILTDNTTAEFTKIALNAYFATKVIFANQIYDFAQLLGANYEKIAEVMSKHPYGPKNHFKVWFKGKRGVNGHCLPKDTQALAHYGNLELLKKVMELNEKYIHIKENV